MTTGLKKINRMLEWRISCVSFLPTICLLHVGNEPGQRNPRKEACQVTLPRNCAGGGQDSPDDAPISYNADDRQKQCANLALEKGE